MITNEQFKGIEPGDVFYQGSTRFAVESIEHKTEVYNGQTRYTAMARTSAKKSIVSRGTPTIQKGFVTFLHLAPYSIDKLVKKDKVRGTREYKSRKDYPLVKLNDRTPLEASENNDCTVRALAAMLDKPYDEMHAFMKSKGRKNRHGFRSGLAYGDKGLVFTSNHNYSLGGLLKAGILPARAIVMLKGHVMAVIDGIVHDTGKFGKNSKVRGWYTYAPTNQHSL
jgi:hypothetical protein